jgi:hypothetical protein
MTKRRQQVFRLARKLMASRSSNPDWYWRNFNRLNRTLNGESPFNSYTVGNASFRTEIGEVRAL